MKANRNSIEVSLRRIADSLEAIAVMKESELVINDKQVCSEYFSRIDEELRLWEWDLEKDD